MIWSLYLRKDTYCCKKRGGNRLDFQKPKTKYSPKVKFYELNNIVFKYLFLFLELNSTLTLKKYTWNWKKTNLINFSKPNISLKEPLIIY